MTARKTCLAFVLPALFCVAPASQAAITVMVPFAASYSTVNLGSANGVLGPYGGLVFKAGDPNTLLLGGSANSTAGTINNVSVVRGAGNHVTGFTGTATVLSTAPGQTFGGIDGGLTYGPGNVLLYTGYSDNSLGQIKPGSTVPDKFVDLDPLGITSSVGWVGLVPAGFPGAGRLKLLSYNSGRWYDAALTPDGAGTFNVTGVSANPVQLASGPEGAIYIAGGNPQFPVNSLLICNYQAGTIDAFEINGNGDPLPATKRPFISGLTGAEGAAIDPLTGDFFFSTFGGGNQVIEVNGFLAPEPAVVGPLALAALALCRRRAATHPLNVRCGD